MEHALEMLLSGVQFRKLLEKRFAALEAEYDLCRIDIQILCYLHASGTRNTAGDIAALGLFSKGHISQSLHRMLALGYIDAALDAGDHRYVHIRPTGAADALIERAGAIYREIDESVFDGMTREETRALTFAAEKLNNNVKRMLADAPEARAQ